MGDAPDHQRLAAEVLGIRGAPPELARRLVAQALVLEDRRDVGAAQASASAASAGDARRVRAEGCRRPRAVCRQGGQSAAAACARISRSGGGAPSSRRSLASLMPSGRRSARSSRRCCARRRSSASCSRRSTCRSAAPALETRAIPRALVRDIIVARAIGRGRLGRIRRRARGRWRLDDSAHAAQRRRSRGAREPAVAVLQLGAPSARTTVPPLAPIVYSWLAGAGRPRRASIRTRRARCGRCARGSPRCCATSGCFTSGWTAQRCGRICKF